MAELSITIVDKPIKSLMNQLHKTTATFLRPLFRDFGEHMVGSVRKNFLVGGRPTPWLALKATSKLSWALKRKTWRRGKSKLLTKRGQEVFKARKPLIDTGGLMASIHWELIPGGVGIGTNKIQARIHQFGGPKATTIIRPKYRKALYWPTLDHPVKKSVLPAGAIPARPFLMVQTEDWDYLTKRAAVLLLFGIK